MKWFAALDSSAMSKHWPDFAIALAIFLIAAFWGGRFVQSGGITPSFYQRTFAPAVMEACGKGFVSPARLDDIPTLSDFLHLKTASFSCEHVPVRFEQESPDSPGSRPVKLLQLSSRYLMGAVALNWRLTGISWSALLPLYALLYGISSAAVYGVFRLGMGKALAAGLAILIVFSPLQLNNLPHLRDYAKAPFILAIVFLLGALVKYSLVPKKTLLTSALLGAVLGVGIGFRMDLLVFIPAVFFTLAFFTPSGTISNIGVRVRAMGVFVLAFASLGWPILIAMQDGGNTFHVILLGLFSPFDLALNVQPSPVYEWGYLYHDVYASEVLNSYAHRLWNIGTPLRLATAAYDQAGMAYYYEIFRQFPADLVTRSLAAILKVVQTTGAERLPQWVDGFLPIAMLMSLLVLAIYSLRYAVFLLVAVVFLGGYPSLQFSERHYFHLQIVPLFFIGFLGQQVLEQNWRLLRQFGSGAVLRVGKLLIMLLALFVAYWALREYQQGSVAALLQKYADLKYEEDMFEVSRNLTDRTARLRPLFLIRSASNDQFPLRTDYWRLELGRCGQRSVNIEIKFRYSDPWFSFFSRPVILDARTQNSYIFHTYSFTSKYGVFPGFLLFDGIDISEDDLPCIRRFGRLTEFESLPLLLNLTFMDGWKQQTLYQSIGRKNGEFDAKRVGVSLFTFPERLALGENVEDELLRRISHIAPSMRIVDKSAAIAEGVLTVKGDAPSAFGYALQLPAESSDGGRYLVAEGEVFDGGLTLGLLKNSQWAAQTSVTTAGKFRIVMKPEAGDYTAILAHNVPDQRFNHFKVTKLGWVREGEKSDAAIPVRTADPAGRESPAAKSFLAFPENLAISEKQLSELLARVRIPATGTPAIDHTVTIANGAVTVKGDAPASFAYALGLQPAKTRGGRYLVAEGELFEGGLTLGLLRNNAWAGQTNVTRPGKFRIVMKPEAGEYTAMLAHNVPGKKFNNFRLTKLGWSPEIK
jgi:hypothetical protein